MWLQHTSTGLFDLKKERVIVAGHHQENSTVCADASDSNNLHRNIFDAVMIHQLF
jgi:hypothetical protein